jgi:hypothetical protein
MKNRGPTTILFIWTLVLSTTCSSVRETRTVTHQHVATSWADLTLFITRNTPSNSPTYASRALGYIGLTMYESVVHGYPGYNSLSGQLNGLPALPTPVPGAKYEWMIALNAGQAAILKKIYNQTSDENKLRIDSLENAFLEFFSDQNGNQEIISRSVTYGKSIAEAIFQWSLSDGGHRGYLNNFDKTSVREARPGSWEPPLYGQSFSHYPLHPRWGENRPFLKSNQVMEIPLLIEYNAIKNSKYYNEFASVLEKSKTLTQGEKEAALWWGDDPGETFTPPGHSYYLATIVIRKTNPELIKCAETYARVGIAVADAFINCWKWKYHFYSERPSSYISKNMDAHWESFWPDPPFPAFPSGHATQAAAVATVLSDLYGEHFDLVDDAHVGRPKDELRQVEFKPRSFSSFWQVAEETANSRFYGGIHSPQDNAVGLTEGAKMGRNVNALSWHNKETYAASGN